MGTIGTVETAPRNEDDGDRRVKREPFWEEIAGEHRALLASPFCPRPGCGAALDIEAFDDGTVGDTTWWDTKFSCPACGWSTWTTIATDAGT